MLLYTGLTLSLFAGSAYSHYHFGHLIVNDTVTPKWKYIRDPGSALPLSAGPGQYEFGKVVPIFDIDSDVQICGREAGSGPRTDVATVAAGSEVGFKLADIWVQDSTVFHDGPGQVYLSHVPEGVNVKEYDGKGDWFKIAYAGPTSDTEWYLIGRNEFRFRIPPTTPPGQYLMRMEQFWVATTIGSQQWYISCAQINVVGRGGGKPESVIQFPGYDKSHPGILVTEEQFGGKDLLSYAAPGPPVWSG